jgi:phenylacetaldehyde dehydrogenase
MTTGTVRASPASRFLQQSKRMLIDGEWVEAAHRRALDVYDPALGEVIDQVPEGDAEDIDLAVRAARRALEHSAWSRLAASERGRLIWRIGDLILENADELAALESLDNGKPLSVASAVDVPLSADLFHYMSGFATKVPGRRFPVSVPYPLDAQFRAYTLKEPIGVVGQILPWNFPLLMAAWKLGPALAAGCTVVLKPAEQTPLSALRLSELMLEAGLPNGVINVVTGFDETGRRGDCRPPRDRQGRVHGLDRGRKADRRGRRGRRQAGERTARREVPERRIRRRGRRDGDRRRDERDLLQPRAVLQRRLAPVYRARVA